MDMDSKKRRKAQKGHKIQFFSDITRKFYQLWPTKTVPALRINAVPMHRFAKVDPAEHTRRIIEAAKPSGKVLDICTGLGYSAIAAAKIRNVREVSTIEKDSEVLHIAKLNEASAELFKNPKIKIIEGDATQKIGEFAGGSFDSVIHDPPTFVVAPELYTAAFCQELQRVLKSGGRLWFYAAEPGKAGAGGNASGLSERIIRNLQLAGFKDTRHDGASTGIIARK